MYLRSVAFDTRLLRQTRVMHTDVIGNHSGNARERLFVLGLTGNTNERTGCKSVVRYPATRSAHTINKPGTLKKRLCALSASRALDSDCAICVAM